MIRRLCVVAFALMAAACAGAPPAVSTPAPGAEVQRPIVILISIDGLRPDYLERGLTPVLSRLAAEGASGPMRPSFPTVTFPNHYTLVTGLHPDRHGIVNNTMEDAELGRFTLGTASAVTDRRWWDEGEPIWVTAERAGLVTGTMFWPGSEAAIRGVRPRHWTVFDQSLPGNARVDQVLDWLDLSPGQRPDFATLYFDIVDTAGHNHGPDADETNAAVASVDASLGRLEEGLKDRGLWDRTVLVIVSDHGMAATSPDRAVYLDDVVPIETIRIVTSGSLAGIEPRPGHEATVTAALVADHPHMDCWLKADVPERLAFGSHRRIPPIVCSAEVGWLIVTRERPVRRAGGAHGYDNFAPEMAAVFIAHGPGVAQGVILDDLDSVDVQPFLGRLLGIGVPDGDGRIEDTLPALTQGQPAP